MKELDIFQVMYEKYIFMVPFSQAMFGFLIHNLRLSDYLGFKLMAFE